jgi:hypothetical protein
MALAAEPFVRRGSPSPAVIRRRRAVALGGLTGMIALPLALVALGGGSAGTDSEQITELLGRGATAPPTLCDHLSGGMLQAIGGHDACVAASPERGPGGEVTSVRVHGSTATAVVTKPTGQETITLVRENGAWKLDSVD